MTLVLHQCGFPEAIGLFQHRGHGVVRCVDGALVLVYFYAACREILVPVEDIELAKE